MIRFLRLAAFALVALTTLVLAEYEYDEGVLVLEDDNFDEAIKEHEMIMVEFYAPWCGHCKKLAPEYAKAATELKADKLVLAKLDATENKAVAEKFEIRGYPTLKLFKNGSPIEYQGGRTADALVAYMRKKSGPAAVSLKNKSEVKAFTEKSEVAVVGFFSNTDSPAAKAFVAAADLDEKIPYGICTDNGARKEHAKEAGGDAVVVFKKFDDGAAVLAAPAETTQDVVSDFVGIQSMRLLEEFTPESSSKIFGGPIKVHLLFFAKKDADDTAALSATVKKIAEEQRGKILHVLVPHTEDRIMSFFQLTEKDLPTVMLADMKADIKKFKYDGAITEDKLRAFEADYLSGKLKPFLKSEDASDEDEKEDVKVIKGVTFEPKVMESDKDVLLEFYAPWCGHCKSLAPKYEELAKKFKGKDSVVVAKMDATANEIDHPKVSVRGFPTIVFFPGKDKANPVVYNGGREVDDMAKFIMKHASTPVTVEGLDASDVDEDEDDTGSDEL